MSQALSTLNRLKATSLLEGSHLLSQVSELAQSLAYKSDNTAYSFDDYFLLLQEQTDALPTLALLKSIPTNQSDSYKIELGNNLESIEDRIERLLNKTIVFRGRLQNAQSAVSDLAASFEAWYTVAAMEFLKEAKIALPTASVKAIATSEFNEMMGRSNLDVDVVLESVKTLEKQLASKKKRAREKYETGKDQANASWASNLPELPGFLGNRAPGSLLRQTDEVASDEDAYYEGDEGEEAEEQMFETTQPPHVGTILSSNSLGSVDVYIPGGTVTLPCLGTVPAIGSVYEFKQGEVQVSFTDALGEPSAETATENVPVADEPVTEGNIATEEELRAILYEEAAPEECDQEYTEDIPEDYSEGTSEEGTSEERTEEAPEECDQEYTEELPAYEEEAPPVVPAVEETIVPTSLSPDEARAAFKATRKGFYKTGTPQEVTTIAIVEQSVVDELDAIMQPLEVTPPSTDSLSASTAVLPAASTESNDAPNPSLTTAPGPKRRALVFDFDSEDVI